MLSYVVACENVAYNFVCLKLVHVLTVCFYLISFLTSLNTRLFSPPHSHIGSHGSNVLVRCIWGKSHLPSTHLFDTPFYHACSNRLRIWVLLRTIHLQTRFSRICLWNCNSEYSSHTSNHSHFPLHPFSSLCLSQVYPRFNHLTLHIGSRLYPHYCLLSCHLFLLALSKFYYHIISSNVSSDLCCIDAPSFCV